MLAAANAMVIKATGKRLPNRTEKIFVALLFMFISFKVHYSYRISQPNLLTAKAFFYPTAFKGRHYIFKGIGQKITND
ncbi:hypothetical protein HMPREF9441_01517 [Paraprevotella clara YIT 11840]|jgi:hypothetical protein|uniref:Uncharacterized protein n=1 Tax=Paraprevotella clara YIT 11840 TaxID=762968 RepID=G5SQ81_9BACT|nr:hypothetical protein HMPREF9441_01517 [Paraprevotella clara YIT 11840]MBD9176799.1 hypothetical protein [Paraprevotella clara]